MVNDSSAGIFWSIHKKRVNKRTVLMLYMFVNLVTAHSCFKGAMSPIFEQFKPAQILPKYLQKIKQ
jgi:hypothetical protein